MKSEETNGIESRIIEAAKLVFVRKGYEATTMSDIAAEVGINRTALHYYFRTKELMFEAIFVQLMGALLPNIDLLMNQDTSILEKLPQLIDTYISALHQNKSFPLFVINEMNRDPAHLLAAVLKNVHLVHPIQRLKLQIEDEMQRGLINRLPLEDLVSSFLALIIFPMLIRNPLTFMFMNGDTEAFDCFMDKRKQLIYQMIFNLLSPSEARDESIDQVQRTNKNNNE